MFSKNKSLKDLLLFHQVAFILLISISAAAGAYGIHLWGVSSQETQRINALVTELQQTRGDLYRQMKELFDIYFLEDANAQKEYNTFTLSVEKHYQILNILAIGENEKLAIKELHSSYKKFVVETPKLFEQLKKKDTEELKYAINTDIETGLFDRYEKILNRTEQLLNQKQSQLNYQLANTKRIIAFLLAIPLLLAILLLIISRFFLQRSIVKPINTILIATSEISAGNLNYQAPEEGAAELAAVSKAINQMADKLAESQEALIRSEKQAAQGLLVPMLAHNIRNPLASIRATAQIIEVPKGDFETQESLNGIINTVDRLERWTGALLAYLLPLKPMLDFTSVQAVIEGAIEPLQQKLKEKSIKLLLPNWPVDTSIHTDQHLLEQVFYNLLLNAVDASKHAGEIELQFNVFESTYLINLLDNGSGIPFKPDPCSISAPSTKRFGTGIGIPFAFKVCDALNAELKFETRESGGTIISILLVRATNAPIYTPMH
ncbi:MAG: HAMP domain-containing sensor histidine kinase [Methylophilaceae bacterium]